MKEVNHIVSEISQCEELKKILHRNAIPFDLHNDCINDLMISLLNLEKENVIRMYNDRQIMFYISAAAKNWLKKYQLACRKERRVTAEFHFLAGSYNNENIEDSEIHHQALINNAESAISELSVYHQKLWTYYLDHDANARKLAAAMGVPPRTIQVHIKQIKDFIKTKSIINVN